MFSSISRRELLQYAGGLGLTFSLPTLSPKGAETRGPERPKSLIVLWMSGGPSQLETWDPHPGARIGGSTQAIATSIPEVRIAATFPRLAEQLHHLSIIRSLVSKEGDHERGAYAVRTGYRPDPTTLHPSLGAIAIHERPNVQLEIPQYVSLGTQPFPPRAGYLGDRYDPYRIYAPGESGQNLKSPVDAHRQQRRLQSLDRLTQTFRQGRSQRVDATLHQHTVDAALQMMSSSQLAAFSIKDEPLPVRARYGDTEFGRGCLVARRLIEQGVRSIDVVQDGFDTHADNFTGHTLRAGIMDPAISSLLADLAERDLLDSTVILVIGEFGRTPNINPFEGRDHWPHGFSCLVGGGGLRGGVVIGATDPEGLKKEPSDPVTIPDLYATILKTLQIDYARELLTPIGRPLKLSEGTPLQRLLA